jgi:hypothetical protein
MRKTKENQFPLIRIREKDAKSVVKRKARSLSQDTDETVQIDLLKSHLAEER